MCDVQCSSSNCNSPKTTSGTTPNVNQVWVCDICRVASFATFNEAVVHEEACHLIINSGTREAKTSIGSKIPERKKKEQKIDANLKQKMPEAPTSVSNWLSSAKRSSSNNNNNNNTNFNASDMNKMTTTRGMQPTVIDLVSPAPTSKKATLKKIRKSAAAGAKPVPKTTASKASVSKTSHAVVIPAMFAGMDTKVLMAEQAAVERRAKRLLKEQQQRERNAKRRKQQQQQQETSTPVHTGSSNSAAAKARATQFPVPSHVIPASNNYDNSAAPMQTQTNCDQWWKSRRNDTESADPDEIMIDVPLLPSDDLLTHIDDPLRDCLESILLPPAQKSLPSSRLWADIYYPRGNATVESKLTDMIQLWMCERQKASDRAAERQRKLTKTKLKKPRKKTNFNSDDYLDDDNLWDDDDDENANRQNVVLLTGPSGVGKTAIVHKVSRDCNCQVLEINTSQRRGASALRKVLEEATQSHSSLALLQQKQKVFDQSGNLEDSDQKEATHSQVTVVLIDEVDNLYNDAGDAGFWTALADLTMRAKCPIFLTANSIPDGIAALSGRYTHVDMDVSARECCASIRSIVEQEGFIYKDNVDAEAGLFRLADMCKYDLRRISHELQMFSLYPSTRHADNMDSAKVCFGPTLRVESACAPVDSCASAARIESVSPQGVRFDEYTLVTIKGFNFLTLATQPTKDKGYPVEVQFGDQLCLEARIMSDTTVLAVCAPFPKPYVYRVEEESNHRHAHHHSRCYCAEYKAVSIASVRKASIASSTKGFVSMYTSPDGTKLLEQDSPCFLEVHYSTVMSSVEDDIGLDVSQSDSEREFDSATNEASLCVKPMPAKAVDHALISQTLRSAICEWTASVPALAGDRMPPPSIYDLRALSRAAALESDAALLEDLSTLGRPYLSGACRGFGFDLTEAYPSSTNEKSKP
jgi:DNA polymerase III delta prime subunit